MITKEFMDYFVEKFKLCYELDDKWNQRLFSYNNSESLTNLFFERSKDYRDAFNINEEIISELKANMHNDLSVEEARILYDAIMGLYFDGYDDFIVLEIVFIPLTEYFRSIQDLDRLIPLLHAYAYEESGFYLESNNTNNEESLRYYYEILSYQNQYSKIKNKESRLCFFKAYSNLLVTLSDLIKTDIMKYFQIRKRALGFWNSKIVQNIDGNDPLFLEFVDRITTNIFKIANVDELPKEALQVLRLTIKNYDLIGKDDDKIATVDYLKYKLSFHDKKIDIYHFLDKSFEMYNDNMAKFKNCDDEDDSIDYLENCDSAIHDILDHYDENLLSSEEKQKIATLIESHRKFLTNLPYGYCTKEINIMVYEFYQACHHLLKSFNEKLDFILEDMMYRQPITCIHSIMVKNISNDIALAVLDKKPELFIGILDTKNVDDVILNKEKILEYISVAALLHDVGKFTCCDIVNTQTRRLDDREFKIVMTHPFASKLVLDEDEDFKDYYDVMIGHHRYYDGSFGYPNNFDNINSKYKIIIDLICIADSIDAATDVLGRNYTKGKLYIDLLRELKRDSGTRYNPDIVNILSDDLVLIERLSDETTNGRIKVYDYVYHKYIK